MKVLFDHQVFSIQKYGGASKYFCELLKNIPQENWDTSTLFSNNEYLKVSQLITISDPLAWVNFKRKSFVLNLLNRPFSIYKLRKGDYDIFHQTHFETYCLNSIGKKKMVTTFHDMNHVKFAGMYKYSFIKGEHWMENVQKKSLSRADKIIAISQNTKKDLMDFWGIDKNKITVIHHGVDKVRIPDLPIERAYPKPYILFVGERDGFKNFDRFIKAFSSLVGHYKDICLICTGKRFSIEEINTIKNLGIDHRVVQISASERFMAQLYRDAEMLLMPSLSEGFGMPALEAMVYDCPVVLSQTSCFPEIVGDAGLYFDPYEIDDISQKMSMLLDSTNLKNSIIERGQQKLKNYSWEKTANEHVSVYKSLMP